MLRTVLFSVTVVISQQFSFFFELRFVAQQMSFVVVVCCEAMNVATEPSLGGLTTTAATTSDCVLSCFSTTEPMTSSPATSSSVTSSQRVDFAADVETDDVDTSDKSTTRSRFLTAKYPKHQMGLIRRRLNVEDWIDEQLKLLFDVVSSALQTLHEVTAVKTSPQKYI